MTSRLFHQPDLLDQLRGDDRRPVLFAHARVLTGDPLIGDLEGDVLLGGPVIVGVGPGLVTAAGDDGAIVVDVEGATVVPAVVDALALAGLRAGRADTVGTLTPGNPADLIVVPTADAVDAPAAVATLLRHPENVIAVVVGGRLVHWYGQQITTGAPVTPGPPASPGAPHDRVGMWIDRTGFLHQELTADGRYDETRGGRPHAYAGRYWVDGDRIDYLDDLGFWAFGEFRDGELHHAGYVLRRS